MNVIDEQIKKGEIKPVYLLYGTEDYLKRFYKNRLIKATVNEGDSMNFTVVEGPCESSDEIINLSNTMPFFADRRVVLIEKSGLFGRSDEKLAACIKALGSSTLLIFVEDKVNMSYAASKAVLKIGEAIELKTPEGKELDTWIGAFLKRYNKQITKNAIDEFNKRTPPDLNTISMELSKLVDYCWDKDSITPDDIRAIVTEQSESKIFDMISALARKDPATVMRKYHSIINDKKENPLLIMSRLSNQFRQMLWIKSLDEKRMSDEDIRSEAGLRSTRQVYMIRQVARNFSSEEIYKILGDIAEYDAAIKTGGLNDRIAVEMLIIKYSK
ncbi:MAG: DNA polymerase III subunit delta [Lachnospiraceae bacterium]|nr:DNA polymerase III subunit delta [Lachnospiraceae bacterium]